jgi:hypothetical protein
MPPNRDLAAVKRIARLALCAAPLLVVAPLATRALALDTIR